jgi:predicted RNase H-like nuclease (RuvC/YqgF family)
MHPSTLKAYEVLGDFPSKPQREATTLTDAEIARQQIDAAFELLEPLKPALRRVNRLVKENLRKEFAAEIAKLRDEVREELAAIRDQVSALQAEIDDLQSELTRSADNVTPLRGKIDAA